MTDLIAAATERLLSTVDHLADDDWGSPSVCVGWSRAHVIAHLALNAEGLAGVASGLAAGEQPTMYASAAARDADIDDLASAEPGAVRERLRLSAAALARSLPGLATVPAGTTFERTPGGRVMVAAQVPLLRLREVEIHHADLTAGYEYADWPASSAILFADHDAGRHDGEPFTAVSTDLGVIWTFGRPKADAAVVTGPASGIAWFATGRDPGDRLTSTTGTLPTMEGR